MYDKGTESGSHEPFRRWRAEIEWKYSHAAEIWENNSQHLADPMFCAKLCELSLTSARCSWPSIASGSAQPRVEPPEPEPQSVGKLALWLHHSVRPTMPRVLSVFTVTEVLEMLGLSNVAMPRGNDGA